MKKHVLIGALALSLCSFSGLASAKGCLKGAAVGAVGGHVAGHHGLLGAAAGCAVGTHMANKKEKAQGTASAQPTPQSVQSAPAQTSTTKP